MENRSGGIQRFKLGLHGASVSVGVVVGYVQASSASHWLEKINAWIRDLALQSNTEHDSWHDSEQLTEFRQEQSTRAARSVSRHPRPAVGSPVELCHLWIELVQKV
jgi:hypothetical protein